MEATSSTCGTFGGGGRVCGGAVVVVVVGVVVVVVVVGVVLLVVGVGAVGAGTKLVGGATSVVVGALDVVVASSSCAPVAGVAVVSPEIETWASSVANPQAPSINAAAIANMEEGRAHRRIGRCYRAAMRRRAPSLGTTRRREVEFVGEARSGGAEVVPRLEGGGELGTDRLCQAG